MNDGKYRTVEDVTYGFRRLDPIPSQDELSGFYESRYYDLIRKGERAPDLRRLLEGGTPAERERWWLRECLHTDILELLNRLLSGRKLLEVGCGTGEFLSLACERGFQGVGIEPATEAVQLARAKGLNVQATTLEKLSLELSVAETIKFDAVVMLNVLEHIPDPVTTVRRCKDLLNPKGVLCIRVPNDFSEIQLAARAQIKKSEWWLAIPDHINYFSFQSLHNLLDGMGFDVVHAQGDFPMEMFLLMGDDYIGNPQVGSSCHGRRVRFDLALPPVLRRKIYAALAEAGIGRECLVFGRLRGG